MCSGVWNFTCERQSLGLYKKLWNNINNKEIELGILRKIRGVFLNYVERVMDHFYENITSRKIDPFEIIWLPKWENKYYLVILYKYTLFIQIIFIYIASLWLILWLEKSFFNISMLSNKNKIIYVNNLADTKIRYILQILTAPSYFREEWEKFYVLFHFFPEICNESY